MARIGRWALAVASSLVTLAWGVYCFLLVQEYVTDYWGTEWSIDGPSTVAAVALWVALAGGSAAAWLGLRRRRVP